jgi:hypothetical protein
MPALRAEHLALFAVVALSLAIGPSCGFYTPGAFAVAFLALGLSLAACFWPMREASHESTRSLHLTFSAVGATLSGEAAWLSFSSLLYAENNVAYVIVQVASWSGFLVMTAGFVAVLIGRIPLSGFQTGVILLFLSGAILRGSVLFASSVPVIDVFNWLRDAPGYVLHGENPYAADYDSPYETERAKHYGVAENAEKRPAAYPPLPILMAMPFRAVGLDVRWANVVCDLLAALWLLLAGRARGDILVGALAAGTYLHFPRAPFQIEQAWFEPMLAATLGAGLLLMEKGRRWPGAVMLALGLTGKQFGVMLLPSLWHLCRCDRLALALALLGVLVVVFLPFFLWGPKDFLEIVLFAHLRRPAQFQSLTFLSAAHDLLGAELPRWSTLLPGLMLIGLLAWRTPQQGTAIALWMGTSLLVFCLCHTQGYFNYFYLCQYLWLLGVVGLSGVRTGTEVQSSALEKAV